MEQLKDPWVRARSAPDLTTAAAYIAALAGDPDQPVTFQTFDDSNRKRPWLTAVLHGTLARLAHKLIHASSQGAGVFVMVNQGDGHGRRAGNVTALRALVADDDTGTVLAPAEVPPNMTVTTKNGSHFYWLLPPGEALIEFKPAQLALARRLGTDPAICDLPRVMRLPGFPHQKDPAAPFQVGFELHHTERLTIGEVAAGLGLDLTPPPPTPATPFAPARPRVVGYHRLRQVMAFYTSHWRPGQRHLLALSFGAYCFYNYISDAEAESLLLQIVAAAGDTPTERQADEWLRAVSSAYYTSQPSIHTWLERLGLALPPAIDARAAKREAHQHHQARVAARLRGEA